MSVIVRGIKKPNGCDNEQYRCPFLDDTDDCKLQDCDPDWSWEEQYKGCPLVEIPEGARLIDAEALYSDIIHRFDYCDDFLEMLEEAPTIFEEG